MYNIYIKTTNKCNLTCKHCYVGNIIQPKYLDFEKLKSWIELNSLDKEDNNFIFHGGEPLLGNLDDMIQFTKSIKSANISIVSNLSMDLTDKRLELLSLLDNNIATSFDTERFSTESFNKWIYNITKLLATHDISLNVTITKKLLDYPITKLLNEIFSKFSIIDIERLQKDGRAEINTELYYKNSDMDDWLYELYYEYNKEPRDYEIKLFKDLENGKYGRCTGQFCRDCSKIMLTVNEDDSIAGCPNKYQKIYGTLNNSIRELFSSKNFINFVKQEKNTPEYCRKCDLYGICRGDCQYQQFDETGCAVPKKLLRKLLKNE